LNGTPDPWARIGNRLVAFGEIHAVSELQSGYLAGAVVHFQVGLEQFDVDHLALHGALTLSADAVQGQIAIMGFDELTHDGIHDARILEAAALLQNPANTLEGAAIAP
jgi:hypothetical protein